MRARLVLTLVAVLILTFTRTPSADPIVYSNGSAMLTGGEPLVGNHMAADDFVLASGAALTNVTFSALASTVAAEIPRAGFSWSIFSNGANQPGTVITSGFVPNDSVTSVRTGGMCILDASFACSTPRAEYRVSFALPSVGLGPGTYWLGLHSGTPTDVGGSNFNWTITTVPGNAVGGFANGTGFMPTTAVYRNPDMSLFRNPDALTFDLEGSPLTFKDVAQNKLTAFTTNGSLKADFTPMIPGVPNILERAASLASAWTGERITHFNWIQDITGISVPGVGSLPTDNPLVQVGVQLTAGGRGLGTDPALGGNPSDRIIHMGFPTADNLPFYYDERTPEFGSDDNSLSKHTTDRALEILDSPRLLIPGSTVTFSDYLVGVTEDNRPIFFKDLDGLGFRWSYTQGPFFGDGSAECLPSSPTTNQTAKCVTLQGTEDGFGSTSFLGYINSSDFTPELLNHLATITQVPSSVPEPASLVLACGGLIVLMLWSKWGPFI